MKHLVLYLLMVSLSVAAATPAHAQTPVTPKTPLVNQHLANVYEQRSTAWWNALGRQLTLSIDVSTDEVDDVALQNIIFFASHYREKVNLKDAAPRLLDIYEQHDQEAYRMMALVALHAIGDSGTMRKLNQAVKDEASDKIRHVTIAALHDYYNR